MEDTIVALATPQGIGAIAVIRISGIMCLEIINNIFKQKNNSTNLVNSLTHTVHYGYISKQSNNYLDEVLVTVMKAPNTYTGEDVVEISCHNSLFVINNIINLCIRHGARLANPGEFTKRAFLNNKKDLMQVEAVVDVINANNKIANKVALNQLKGDVSCVIQEWRNKLVSILSFLNFKIDHDEQNSFRDIDLLQLAKDIESLINEIKHKVKWQSNFLSFKHQVRVIITGKPNVGKSSIFNRLIETNKAITTNVPGTTRDVVTESMDIKGVQFCFVDTAGVRVINFECSKESNEYIECLGIDKTIEELENADYIIFVLDLSRLFDENDAKILKILQKKQGRVIVLGNKVDQAKKLIDAKNCISKLPYIQFIEVSALQNIGIDKIRDVFIEELHKEENYFGNNEAIMVNMRQQHNIEAMVQYLTCAGHNINANESLDIIEHDINQALLQINELVGVNVTDEVLNNIFSTFCVGK